MTIKQRYSNLPGKNGLEKSAYVIYCVLLRFLVRRQTLDINGERFKPMRGFATIEATNMRENQRIVCLSGLGHSGSGAVADLLSEYEDVDVRSHVDRNGSLKNFSSQEFDFLCSAGGVFQLEDAFLTRNESYRDVAVKAFLHFVASLYVKEGGDYNKQFLDSTRRFLDNIILYKSKPVFAHGYAYCPHMQILGTLGARLIWGDACANSIYWLKNMSFLEYRKLAKDYLREVISTFSAKSVLVLDQVVSDGSADMEKYESYLGAIRLITVYRDPRDVFATAVKLKENWIPTDPDMFIRWYRYRIAPYLDLCHRHFKLVRFEDLVLNYASVVSEVEAFIGIDCSAHTRKKSCFDPEISRKNIGLYESLSDKGAIRKIEQELGDFCWHKCW